ncbi:hypothetical protein EHS43_24405 [Streptomyces sp. RP5T]|nr:hypothetical protein EHS43_24405 [Streptomyces sp. RP5T]
MVTHVPDEGEFATTPQLAVGMLERACALGINARWTADGVYGGRELRVAARRLGFDYAMAVKTDHRVTASAGTFTAAVFAGRVPRNAWARMRTGRGLKGDRPYDWALLDVPADDTPTGHEPGHSRLVIRRHRCTGEFSFYRCQWTLSPIFLGS